MAYDEKIKRAYTASIHFKKSIAINAEHNDRLKPPSYLISHDDKDYEFNRNSHKAKELKNQIIENAKEAYTKHTGQKFQAKSYEWSAVCNIKDSTTMQELEKLTEHFQKKYGFQCYQIAIHRDEGHINEQGEKVINHHAHLEFITLDRETGKNNYNRQKISPSVLRQIQTEVAEILGMERGQEYFKNGVESPKRIEPRKYAQMKEREKRERKELTQELSQEKTKNRELQAELTATKKELESAKSDILKQKEAENYTKRFKKILANRGFEKPCFDEINALQRDIKAKHKSFTEQELKKELVGIFFKHRKGRLKRIRAKKAELQNIQEPQEPTTDSKELEALKELLDIKLQSIPKQTYENYCKGKYFQDNKEADKDYLQNFLIENTKPYRQQRGILESQKKKIDDLEAKLSDLSAKNQKNEDLLKENQKNDFRAISDDLNDTKPQNYSNDIIKACFYALNSHFLNFIYDSFRKKAKQAVSEKKKQESLEIFESRAKALQEVSKEKFSEWKQEHSNYKEILENFKNTPAQEQQRTQNQGRSL